MPRLEQGPLHITVPEETAISAEGALPFLTEFLKRDYEWGAVTSAAVRSSLRRMKEGIEGVDTPLPLLGNHETPNVKEELQTESSGAQQTVEAHAGETDPSSPPETPRKKKKNRKDDSDEHVPKKAKHEHGDSEKTKNRDDSKKEKKHSHKHREHKK